MSSFLDFITEKFSITLQYHSRLNSKLWTKTILHDGIAENVMEQALKYAKFCKIPKERVKDVIITGGNVGYNFTKYSDVDCHLLVDLTGLDAEKFKEKQFEYKKLWSQKHKITIEGYPLELFAANEKEKIPDGQGVYSVMRNTWVIIPEHQNWKETIENPLVLRKLHHAYDEAEELIANGTATQIEQFRDKLWRGRAAGLQKAGEFSIENLNYKNLRNLGVLDRLKARSEKLSGALEEAYQEEQGGTFEDNGVLYDINKIFDIAEDKPKKAMRISLLSWIIPDKVSAADRKREHQPDIDYNIPLIVTKTKEGILVVDGFHRLLKAKDEGVATVPVKEISEKELKSTKLLTQKK